MNKKYKLFLINPKANFKHYMVQKEFALLMGKKTLTVPLGLPIVASLTPDYYDIKIIDEDIENIPQDELPDIVGITSVISNLKRAYEIADWYRNKNVKVVLGGFCVSFMQDSAVNHADSVIVGEAKGAWEECLKDFEKNKMKKVYINKTVNDFKTSPLPRWDLVDKNNILSTPIQVSRGCPFKCEFCLVHKIYGNKMKYRDVDDVIKEVKAAPCKTIFFVDDNLTFNKKYAKELMKKLSDEKIVFMCQCSIDVAKDDELLDLMAKAGCAYILIGFESVNPNSLKESRKFHNNIKNYEEAISKIHSKGINIISAFVVGFDSGSLDDFDHIYDFTMKNNIPVVMVSILTAIPGNDLYIRMKKDKRINYINTNFITSSCPTMVYKDFTQLEFVNKFRDSLKKLFSPETIYKKAIKLFETGKFKKSGPSDISPKEKMSAMMVLIKNYLFSKDKMKRKLLFDLFKLGYQKKTTYDNVVSFLLTIESYHIYANKYQDYIDAMKDDLERIDNNTKNGKYTGPVIEIS
jgi:radical SAM superfamily enzyme YgiQ (UPF0313 family)